MTFGIPAASRRSGGRSARYVSGVRVLLVTMRGATLHFSFKKHYCYAQAVDKSLLSGLCLVH
jgi:hypothetical protein